MVIKVKYNGEWVKIPYLSDVHGEELVTEAPKDDKQYARQNGVWTVVNIPEVDFTDIYTALDTKVDKVEGKGLSTEDYLTLDKTKVNNLNEVLENAVLNTTATGSTITLDKRNLVTNAVENIELNLPASTTALAGLMLPSDKTKLNGIAAGAEVNVNADWNATEGDALILNKPTLATVATSGSYNDLTEKPTIPTVDVNKEYVDTQLATKSDLPDYTVFDIFMNIMDSLDTPSISQENYNTLLSKLENNNTSIFPVRSNYAYIISLYGANSDGVLTLKTKQEVEIGNVTNIVLKIEPDLTYSFNTNSTTIDVASNTGIRIQVSQTLGEEAYNENINLHTTGDGTKSLMDDGKYRKLPVYGKNLLLGSGTEVSNSNQNIANYWLVEQIPEGTQVTVTVWAELGEEIEYLRLYNSGGSAILISFNRGHLENGKASRTFNWTSKIPSSEDTAVNTYLSLFINPTNTGSISTIHKIKLEYGDISTEWSPAWEDIPDLEERYAYGVEWDTASSSPDGVRVGNMQLHRELPIQSKIRGVILDNKGGIKSYLNNSNWSNINTEYLTESVMTEIPEHWYKLYQYGTKFRMMLSAIPLPGYSHINQFYISSFESGIDRSSSTLISSYGVGSTNVNKRGGDNTAEWDSTYRSLLGCPVTNLTRDQFRQAARKRGSGWEMYTYGAHKTLFWLFAVEYATLNSQKPFNAQKDANGFSQGGLGNGPTQMTDWTNFNNNNPLIQCGYTNEFGNGSGEKAYVVKNASDGTHATLMANRYRGIENPFGHIWKHTDGANIQVTTGDSGLSILWTTSDPSNFSDTSYTGYDKKGNVCRINGHVKKMLLGEDGDIIATEVGGSTSTYWCDNYYTSTSVSRMQLVVVGGRSDDGLNAGLVDVGTTNSSGIANNIGSRLCFFPKYKSTEITTE